MRGLRSRLLVDRKTLLTYLPAFVLMALEWGLLAPVPAVADNFQFWAAGQLAVTGQSPYERTSWVAMTAYGRVPEGAAINTVFQNLGQVHYPWLYPPQTALAFAPFGALPVSVGVVALHLALLAAAVVGSIVAARAAAITGPRLALALVIAVVAQAFVISVRDGHPIGVVLLGATLVFVGLRDHRAWPLAVGVALVSIKPHIVLAFALAAAAYMVVRDRRSLGVAAASLAAVTVPAEILYPFPLDALAFAARERSELDLSTTGALARDLGGGLGLTILMVAAAVALSALAVRWSPAATRVTVGFGALLALSLVVAPYTHDYDQLLLLPAVFAMFALARGRRAVVRVFIASGALLTAVAWILYFWPLVRRIDPPFVAGPLGAMPLLVLAALTVTALFQGAEPRGLPRPPWRRRASA